MESEKLTDILKKEFPDIVMDTSVQFGDEIVTIEKSALLDVLKFLKNAPHDFAMLLDLTCVDFLGENKRFEMVYHLFSLSSNRRIRIKAKLSEDDLRIDSLASIWRNANWLEREVYDMFGVQFNGHPYMKRIFMWDGFEGYPLRKDYPLRKRQPLIPLRKDDDE